PRAIGSFYQYSQAHGLRRLALPAAVAAGSICFSPDGATMYFSTGEHRLMCCDYDASGAQVANVRPFAELAHATPHGATVDSEGCVWSAGQGSDQLVRHAPDGERIGAWALPVPCATRPAFGGAALDCLMVGGGGARTGARRRGGSLFRLALPGVRGMPDMPFHDGFEP
ncbi:MAG TPA: SMP-30/gluconolactonase/LRE family protein, partial [Pseudoduganella sp.]